MSENHNCPQCHSEVFYAEDGHDLTSCAFCAVTVRLPHPLNDLTEPQLLAEDVVHRPTLIGSTSANWLLAQSNKWYNPLALGLLLFVGGLLYLVIVNPFAFGTGVMTLLKGVLVVSVIVDAILFGHQYTHGD